MDKDNGREDNEIRFGDNKNIQKEEFIVTEVGDLSGACSDGNWDPDRYNRRDRDRRDRIKEIVIMTRMNFMNVIETIDTTEGAIKMMMIMMITE